MTELLRHILIAWLIPRRSLLGNRLSRFATRDDLTRLPRKVVYSIFLSRSGLAVVLSKVAGHFEVRIIIWSKLPPRRSRSMQMVRGWANSKRVMAMTSFGFRGLSFNDNCLTLLRKIKDLSTKIPPWLLHRNVQMLLDSVVAVISLWIAYLLRFDFAIPPSQQRGMAGWLIVIAVARPATILLTDGYKATWRFFAFCDAIRLAARSVPVSICLLLLRAAVHNGSAIPFSVLLLELLLFLWLASALRITRRYGHEFQNRVGSGPNTLIVGSEATLAGAVRHLRASGNTNILGLVTENERLVGL